jgi:gamma-glutamyltranspeptidase/glutathione hydrolase
MTVQYSAVGNQPVAVQAAQEFLLSGGSAVGAVLSGFFAASGAYAGVLLGPLSILVAGIGSGVRAFDGRLRQPGLGTKRPRGFLNDDDIPAAARIAVPQAIAAAVVAHAYDRGGPIAEVLKRGIRQARQVGSEARAEILQSIRGQGARVLSSPSVARPLMHVAGISEGGLLTSADLAAISDLDVSASAHPTVSSWFEAPWADEEMNCSADSEIGSASEASDDAGVDPLAGRASSLSVDSRLMVLVAVDNRGVFAGVAYEWTTNGIAIDGLELEAPACAVPVMRGITRIAPGCPVPAAVPIAIQVVSGQPIGIVCDSRIRRLDERGIAQSQYRIIRDPATRAVTASG